MQVHNLPLPTYKFTRGGINLINGKNECEICSSKIELEGTHQLTTGEQVCMSCYDKVAYLAQPND